MTASNMRRDVHIGSSADLEDFPAPLPWFAQFSDGSMAWFQTEDEACAFQRLWRNHIDLDPITGDAVTEIGHHGRLAQIRAESCQ